MFLRSVLGRVLDRILIAVREIDGETSFASNIVQDPERKCKTRETTCGCKPLPVPVPESDTLLPGFRVIGANTDLQSHRARLRRECCGTSLRCVIRENRADYRFGLSLLLKNIGGKYIVHIW